MFIVALIGADIIQALFNLAVRFTTGSIIANFVENLFVVTSNSIKDNFIALILLIWAHAVFTLGSTIFRKHSLIKTILSLLGASLILTMIIGGLAGLAASSNKEITVHFLVDPMVTFHISSYVIVIGTALGAYYLRAPSSIKNRKNYDFLYYTPNFAKSTLQNTANINIFLHFFCKKLAGIQKRIYFCSVLQQ